MPSERALTGLRRWLVQQSMEHERASIAAARPADAARERLAAEAARALHAALPLASAQADPTARERLRAVGRLRRDLAKRAGRAEVRTALAVCDEVARWLRDRRESGREAEPREPVRRPALPTLPTPPTRPAAARAADL